MRQYRRLSPLARWVQTVTIKAQDAITDLCVALLDNDLFPWALAAAMIAAMLLGQELGMR